MAEAAGAAAPASLLPGLPDEISIWEILVRLPPKALLRCRAVCLAWWRATSTAGFLLAHHRHQPTLPLLHGYGGNSLDIIHFDHGTGLAAAGHLQSVARLNSDFFRLEASCDGLLVLSFNCVHFSICNPATQRGWRRATSAREFLLAHHGRQPCLPIFYNCYNDYIEIVSFDHRAGVAAADQRQSVAPLGLDFIGLEASCDGLLILSGLSGRFSVFNPATRQYAPLQLISGFIILGMYPHHNTGEYRLLLRPESADLHVCHVFALGSCQPPRNIDIGCPYGITMRMPLLFRGNLHWHIVQPGSGSNLIIVFDTTAELFRQMRSPVHVGSSLMFEVDDMLAFSNFNYAAPVIDIWLSQDYESEVWAFKRRIELPVEEISLQLPKFNSNWRVVSTSWDDNVLVLLKCRGWLLHINIDGKLVAISKCDSLLITQVQLKQTLVLHTFFPKLDGYVVNALPFSEDCE